MCSQCQKKEFPTNRWRGVILCQLEVAREAFRQEELGWSFKLWAPGRSIEQHIVGEWIEVQENIRMHRDEIFTLLA
jgi:hypothetical protein